MEPGRNISRNRAPSGKICRHLRLSGNFGVKLAWENARLGIRFAGLARNRYCPTDPLSWTRSP